MWKEIMVAMLVSFLGKSEGSSVENCIACSDIVFLIDDSGSINDAEFLQIKIFIKSVVQLFPNVGPNGAQFGAVSFSSEDDQTTEFDLNDHGDATSVLAAIDSLVNNGTGTHIGAALEYLENNLFNMNVGNGAGRPCAVDNRFAIVITDGKTVGGTVPKAQSLKNANVKILAVGVGDGVDTSLLQAIASGNQNVFLVEDFDTFPSILDGLISSICTQDSGPHGFCGFPCTLHNKTYDLCPCDENNVNQTYSVGGNDTTVFTENFGGENKTDWECYTRSGRFYVVRKNSDLLNRRDCFCPQKTPSACTCCKKRRCVAHDVFEYRCMRDIMYNTNKDIRVYCMSEWASFEGNPSLCDVCDGSAFDKDKALIIKEQSEECGIIVLESGFCGCALPTICPVTNNFTQTQCDACESSEGNDDGLCCS